MSEPRRPGGANKAGDLMFTRTLSFEFLNDRGRLDIETDEAENEPRRLTRVRSTGHRILLEEEKLLTLILPRGGNISVRSGASELKAKPGEALLFPPNRRDTRVTPGRDGAYVASVFQSSLAPLSGWRGDRKFKERLELGDGLVIGRGATGLLALARFNDRIFARGAADVAGSTKGAEVTEVLTELLDDLLDGVSTERTNDPRSVALQLVRKAEEIMHDRRADPLAILDIARELDVSARTMQLAFRHARGVTAREALTRIRLEAVRASLLASGDDIRISDVALDEGFTHLGRFSGLYRKTYGETPSETLQMKKRLRFGRRVYRQFR